jgi:hypothetical protein
VSAPVARVAPPEPPRAAQDVDGAQSRGRSADGAGLVTVLLHFLGAGLCVPYLYTSAGRAAILVFAAAWTAFAIGARRARSRAVRTTARTLSAVLYAVSLYAAVVFTIALGWSLPRWAIALVAAASIAAVATGLRKFPRALRVPALLPLGLLITTVLSGWWREGGRVRCDDFFRVTRQPGVEVAVPSLPGLASCHAGAMLPLNRYPRQIWEAPDGQSVVFTTQAEPFAAETAEGFAGAVCAATSDGGRIRCSGTGKGDGLTEIPAHHRLVALSNGGSDATSHLYVIPIDDPFRNPETVPVENAGSGVYDADMDASFCHSAPAICSRSNASRCLNRRSRTTATTTGGVTRASCVAWQVRSAPS